MKIAAAAVIALIVALVGCSGTEEVPSPTPDVGSAVETAVVQTLPTARCQPRLLLISMPR